MAFTTGSKPARRWLAGAVAVAAILGVGAVSTSANAEWYHGNNYYHHGWAGGYYRSPPVVYGGPWGGYGYYPPPVVYGPGIGVNLPGVSIGIR